jgi:Big-like domain-containing protein/carbohydrate binding protein with CBM6 domain
LAAARDAAGSRGTSATITITVSNAPPPPPADTTPPTVTITAPLSGMTVSGSVTISATASDNIGVVGVQFYVDGVAVGVEMTTPPYQVSWTGSNGMHSLTAAARDAAGNVGRSGAIAVNVANSNTGGQQSPFHAMPAQVPGRIEAEDFDKGGEGVAYHDVIAGNAGGQYRPSEDVDVVSPYPLGYVVNNFQTGEWMEYTIDVTQSGSYRVDAIVSSAYSTSSYRILIDDSDVTGVVAVPNTGWWDRFQSIGKSGIQLTAGRHVMRVYSNAEYFNFDAIEWTLEDAAGRQRAIH